MAPGYSSVMVPVQFWNRCCLSACSAGWASSSRRPHRRRPILFVLLTGLPWRLVLKRSAALASGAANGAASARRVSTLGVAGQSVLGDRLPRCGIGHKLTDARPDPRIVVE